MYISVCTIHTAVLEYQIYNKLIPVICILQVPSLTGKEDDEMEGDQLMFDLDQGFAQGFTQDQVDGTHIL